MICCDCIEKINKVDAKSDDVLILELNKTLNNREMHYFVDSLKRIIPKKKIIIVPNIANIKIGKYTNLERLKKICERIIIECDEAINLYKQKKN